MDKNSYDWEVDSPAAADWSALLDRFADANIYQTLAYGTVRWGAQNLSHFILRRSGEIVGMAQLRIIRPTKALKAGIAYLRWGPVCHLKGESFDPAVLQAMADALVAEYVQKRGLFLRVLPNAQQATPRGDVFEAAFKRFDREPFKKGESYRTIIVNLEPPLEVLRKKLDQKWRNQLNRAEKNNLRVIEGDGAAEFDVVIALFDELWKRKQFSQSSDIREFKRMQEQLPAGQKMKVLIAEQEGSPVAGLIGTAMGDSGIYLFGATSDRGMQSKGSYLLQWRMMQWMKESGIRYYNLGGINPETNPGVYHFKQGFSGDDVLYMPPFVLCESVLSKAFMAAGNAARGGLRKKLTGLLRAK
ncbi:MAG TPA: peptidoglycan bridge formation glycyltransferase FemA/FemB family protein [Verrucomicrobiota bacterium]|nr:peptidoglycan bridge formation glycyltransferase FemA/FemB family protein [Verrucomicrobiota bacterium]